MGLCDDDFDNCGFSDGLFNHHRDSWGCSDELGGGWGDHSVNPANGLPMMGLVDIEGNVYGFDSRDDDDSLWSALD